jgi:hypothetical protein
MQAPWWLRAPEIVATFSRRSVGGVHPRRYKFADGFLVLDCDDEVLVRRFRKLYPEDPDENAGDENAGSERSIRVKCMVRADDDAALAHVVFYDREPLDSFAFCQRLFPDRRYVEGPVGPEGWRTIASRQNPDVPQIALRDNDALVDRRQIWQPFIANYAINRVLRLQHELLFFHAASIGIEGQGAMIVGPKASGKTTTAMALAAGGHNFLGDEIAAVDHTTRAMLPFRRAVSIRTGPRAHRVDEHLARQRYVVEKFPDGSERTLVDVSSIFPESGASSPTLSCVFFLRQFAEHPTAEPFVFGIEHFRMLSPLACSMWGMPAGVRMFDLSRMLRGVRCYILDPGQPEATADLVERTTRRRYLN